jgi:hypothetical protein
MSAPQISLITVYVAFSVHGTNSFITASTTVPADGLLAFLDSLESQGFTVVKSRRPDAKSNEVKLHWNKLLRQEDSKPYTAPSWILRRFRQLAEVGWTVDSKKFKEYHYPKKL